MMLRFLLLFVSGVSATSRSQNAAPPLVLACNSKSHGAEPHMIWYNVVSGDFGEVDEPSPSPLCGNHDSSFTVFDASATLEDGRMVALVEKQNLNSVLMMVQLSVQHKNNEYAVKVSAPIWSRDMGGPGLPTISFGVLDERIVGIASGLDGDTGYGEINLTNGEWKYIAPLSKNVSGSQGVLIGSAFYSAGAVPGRPRDYLQVAGYDFSKGTYAHGCSFKVPGRHGTYPSDMRYDSVFAPVDSADAIIVKGDGDYPLLLTLSGVECGVEAIGAQQAPRSFMGAKAFALLTLPSSGNNAILMSDGGSVVLDVKSGKTSASDNNFASKCDVNNGFINLQEFILKTLGQDPLVV